MTDAPQDFMRLRPLASGRVSVRAAWALIGILCLIGVLVLAQINRTAALIALGDNHPRWEAEYRKLGTTAGCYDDWHEGRDPAGISTQDDELAARFDPVAGGRRIANYLRVLTLETQTLARACGKSHVHNLEPEDLVALTIEAAAMARVPLAGTNWIPGLQGSTL